MAVPMEAVTARAPHLGLTGPVPPGAPLAMPTQDLRATSFPRRPPPALRTRAARLVTFGGGLAMTGLGGWQMMRVVEAGGATVLEGVLAALFVLTFSWISLAAAASIAGLLFCRRSGLPRVRGAALAGRNALVMPVYNEDPGATCAALQAMAEGLIDAGAGKAFEIFILSDTNDPDVWIAETVAFARLRRRLHGRMAV